MLEIETSEDTRVTQLNSCASCSNYRICKYASQYMDYVKDLSEVQGQLPEIVKIEIKCQYFKNEEHFAVKPKKPMTSIRGKQASESSLNIKHTRHVEMPSPGDEI